MFQICETHDQLPRRTRPWLGVQNRSYWDSNQIFVRDSQVFIGAGALELFALGERCNHFDESSGQQQWGRESGATCQRKRPPPLLSFAPSERGRMPKATTVLFAVREGEIWRVQIVWPNGRVHYFGQFASEKDACAWISAHAWLTVVSTEKDDG
jgi:hypothetical protein